MKRAALIALCAFVMLGAFCACAKAPDNSASQSVSEVSTDTARIKDNEAIDLIKEYSNEELGLDDETVKKCSFLVQESGESIDEKNYVKVVAAEKKTNDDGTYTFDIKGEYYISFDGDTVLKKTDGGFEKMKK